MAGVRDFPNRSGDIQDDPVSLISWLDKVSERQNIDLQIPLTAPAVGDELGIFDVSANAYRKITLTDLATILSAGLSAATQAQMEAATSNAVAVTPLSANWHPGMAKAWVRFNAAATVAASWNITSVTDNGVGDWTVNIGTDFSSANYCAIVTSGADTGNFGINCNAHGTPTAGTMSILNTDSANAAIDPVSPNAIFAVFFGDQ